MKALTKRALSLLLAVVMVASMIPIMAVSSSAATEGWTFTEDNLENPFFINNPITEAPQAYEVEINMPESPSGSSVVVGNYYTGSNRYFGLTFAKDGELIFVARGAVIKDDGTVDSDETTQVKIPGYSVNGRGWVKVAVVRDTVIDEEAGIYKAVYTVYENGVKMVTYDPSTASGADERWQYIPQIDVVYSQNNKRKLSIGSHATVYCQGEIKSIGIYSAPLTEEQVKSSYDNGADLKSDSLSAYYDYAMSGNDAGFIKDQTGNGHDAVEYESTFYERKEPLKDYAYSFAVVGDTQLQVWEDYKNNTDDDPDNDTSYAADIYKWILDNKDSKNIKYVMGVGDITENNGVAVRNSTDEEWYIAKEAITQLDNNIEYSLIVGNHDLRGGVERLTEFFGDHKYLTDRITGYYQDGSLRNYYINFEVQETEYTVICLDFQPSAAVLEWAGQVADANPDRRVIVTTHYYMNASGEKYDDGVMWNSFVSQHGNIILVLAGHIPYSNIGFRQDRGINGNIVSQLLVDPQSMDVSLGMICMLYFSEDGKQVSVEWISTGKTQAAQAIDPNAQDILYLPTNQFDFTIETETEGWTFTKDNLTKPFFIENPITEAPQAYEVEINMPASPSGTSVVVGNYYTGSNRYFGLTFAKDGELIFVTRGPVIKSDGTVDSDETTQVKIPGYSVNGRGWVKVAVVRDTVIDEEAGIYKAVYTVYENGVKMVTYDPSTASGADARWQYIPQIDVVHSQNNKRKLSIGSHATVYCQGEIHSIAIYSAPLTEEQVKSSYDKGVDLRSDSLLAYYDYDMSGNNATHIKDQTGNGHDGVVEHTYNVPGKDDTYHWNECFCGAVDESSKENHQHGDFGYCTVCEVTFTYAQLKVGKNLSVIYTVDLFDSSILTEGTTLAVKFYKAGKALGVFAPDSAEDGRYTFTLTGIAPQEMTDILDATLVSVDGEGNVIAELAAFNGYTVKDNLDYLLEAYATDEKLIQLVKDIIAYGGAAQEFTGHNKDNLVSEGNTGASTKTPDKTDKTYTEPTDAGNYFTSANVFFDTENKIIVKFMATSGTKLVVKVGDTVIATVDAKAGVNEWSTEGIAATELDKVFTFELQNAEGTTLQTITYSVNSYCYSMKDSTNDAMRALAIALYNYGVSSKAYVG